MEHDQALEAKVRLQSLGARVPASPRVRCGGAGPSEGINISMGGLAATVPTGAWYVERSPFSVEERADGTWELVEDGRALGAVEIADDPLFYSRRAPDGTPFGMLAVRHGRDAIGSTVAQWCARGTDACGFCGIALTRDRGETVARKDPGSLGLVARAAGEEGYTHAVLTTGTTSVEDAGIGLLTECATAIAEVSDIDVHVQFEPPQDPAYIRSAARVAVSAAVNIESFDADTLARIAPAKHAAGLDRYVDAWKESVEQFGAGQVTSFIIVGLGESRESVLEGCRLLTSLGVYPFVLPLRPIPGTPLGGLAPPPPDAMTSLYEDASRIIESAGLSASDCLAGCVRCGACSSITHF
ncbi:MAG: radical SAM protein [Actinobacteria bacterium]|nr:radical SAM protein [Actinomycetota bacterium]MBU1945306.1 radical SAM protein [Actinomycetota bacterium]MBU2686506.1 radical SAM protein [Actinomycetota bacterium]